MSEPEVDAGLQAKVDAISDVMQTFEKVLRAYRMYAADHVTIEQFEAKAFEKITEFLKGENELTVAVKPYEFLLGDKVVYRNTNKQENFSFKFHQDGIRQLTFLQGITRDELKGFVQILRTDYESYEFCDDDAVTLLWKNSFEHIGYVVVETFAEAGKESQDLESVLSQMAERVLEDRSPPSIALLLSGADPAARRKLKRADIEEITHLPDLDVAHIAVDGMEQARLQAGQEDETIVQRMILVLLRVLVAEEQEDRFRQVSTVVRRMVESMLGLANFGLAAKIYAKIKELADSTRNPSGANALLMKTFYDELNEKTVLDSVVKLSLAHGFAKVDDLALFAQTISSDGVPALFEIFRSTEQSELRGKLVAPLAAAGADRLDLFAAAAQSEDPGLAMATLDLFAAIGLKKTALQVKRAFHHQDPTVRAKVLDLVGREGPDQAKALSLSALKDHHVLVRGKALKLLVETGDKKVVKPIFDLTRGAEFDGRELEEKKQFYVALSRLGGAALLPIFCEELKGSVLDRTEKSMDRRIAAISGLMTIGGGEARKYVEEERDRKFLPKAIKDECERALQRWPKE